MADFEKIGKVLDEKMKGLSAISINVPKNEKNLSLIDQLTDEVNHLYMELGKIAYEKEKDQEISDYKELIHSIASKRQEITAELEKLEGKKCQNCGASISDNAVFCPACGSKVETTVTVNQNTCPGCGAPIKAGSKFCVKCGKELG